MVYLIVIPDTSRGLLQKSDHKRGMIMKSSSLLRMKSARGMTAFLTLVSYANADTPPRERMNNREKDLHSASVLIGFNISCTFSIK